MTVIICPKDWFDDRLSPRVGGMTRLPFSSLRAIRCLGVAFFAMRPGGRERGRLVVTEPSGRQQWIEAVTRQRSECCFR